jgi:peptidoglycan/LPS O-acetylase OafA/YrhL
VFFILSGFFVTRSVLTQPTLVSYTTNACFGYFRR